MIYNTTLAIPVCVPFLWFADELVFNNEQQLAKLYGPNVFSGILVCGILGYLINLAIFLQIQLTSPLTGTISGTVKGVLQVVFGWLIFRNEVSLMNGAGIVLVLVGSSYYSWIGFKGLEKKNVPKESDNKQGV